MHWGIGDTWPLKDRLLYQLPSIYRYLYQLQVFLMSRSYIYPALGISLITLDLITKHYLTTVCNTWVSFSMPVSYSFVIPMSIIVAIYISYLAYTNKISDTVAVLIVAGTIGNLYDRIARWCVRDWIVMPWWFVYNIADIYLTIGVIIYIYMEYRGEKQTHT
jgi:signal peptidase II